MILKIINYAQKKPFYFTLIVLSIIIFLEVILIVTPIASTAEYPVYIDVKEKSHLSDLSKQLYTKKIINSQLNFKLVSKLLRLENKLKPGRYKLTENYSYLGLVLFFLNTQPENPISFRILKGSTLKSTIQNLHLSLGYDINELKRYLYNKEYLKAFGFKAETAEGYILPIQYSYYKSDPIDYVIANMLENTRKLFYDTLKITNPDDIHKIVTLSSIVQGETKKVEEYPIIAGVYLNRIRLGMPLQACPTVQYSLQRERWAKITYKDLQVESPYNTYKYKGLPPGPIGNPSIEAIKAVISPTYHNYLFFVADGTGGHKFSEKYSEHLSYKSELKK